MRPDFQQPTSAPAAAFHGEAKPLECPLPPRWKRFSKRVAQVGFVFFALKGVAWLVVAFLAWRGLS